ncbi:hypothetical protein R1sor_007094 [Riccia sorocarpa]|uniref:MULE transposase domain-containing protein n=1 Tax=Riccia sorocarpa TaxID=122646 RepID=A0ABD3HPV9_9MARC
MVRSTFTNSDGEDLDEEDIFDDKEDCDDEVKKAEDGSIGKTKKYPTQLFIAIVVDGNIQIVTLAYVTAPRKNYEKWMWFLQNLLASIEGLSNPNMMIVSDWQKVLEKAVAEVLPSNHHHHLLMNVQKHFGKAAGKVF